MTLSESVSGNFGRQMLCIDLARQRLHWLNIEVND